MNSKNEKKDYIDYEETISNHITFLKNVIYLMCSANDGFTYEKTISSIGGLLSYHIKIVEEHFEELGQQLRDKNKLF